MCRVTKNNNNIAIHIFIWGKILEQEKSKQQIIFFAYKSTSIIKTILFLPIDKYNTCKPCNWCIQYTVKHAYSEHAYNTLTLKVKWFLFPLGFKHIDSEANGYNQLL